MFMRSCSRRGEHLAKLPIAHLVFWSINSHLRHFRIQESNLSKIEKGKIGITQHYAEIFAAVFDVSPLVFFYPNGEFKKSKEIVEVERRAKRFKKHG